MSAKACEGGNDKSDAWTPVIQTVFARFQQSEITASEYSGFTRVVDRARSRGWTPDDVGFDPQTFENELERRVDDGGYVSLGPGF